MPWLLLTHTASTLFMTGVIWLVQMVVYPQFVTVAPDAFPSLHATHSRRISFVVAPAMTVELLSAIALIVWRPAGASAWVLWVGLALVAFVWLSTAFVQVPLHNKLSLGFDGVVLRRLVRSNWIRTIIWSIRSVLVLVLLGAAM